MELARARGEVHLVHLDGFGPADDYESGVNEWSSAVVRDCGLWIVDCGLWIVDRVSCVLRVGI